jgi:PilZ domain
MRASQAVTPDRRQAPRTKLVEIAYIGMGPENGGLVLDVSDGGVSFHAVAPVRQSEIIHFLLSLRGHSRIHGTGEVVWTNEMKTVCGLRFTSLSAGAREHLSNWTNQSRMPESAREGTISSVPSPTSRIEESSASLTRRSDAEAQPVFAIPPAARDYLSQPASRSLRREPLFWGILFGILCSVFVATAFIYGVRVGKSETGSAAQVAVAPDSQATPQASEPAASPAPSAVIDSPSVSAITPGPQSKAPSVRSDVSTVPNIEASRVDGALVNASKTDGILPSPLPLQGSSGERELGARVSDQEHAEEALQAGKSELVAALEALRGTNDARDSSKAARLLWAAVANNNSAAAVVLADLYLRGDGVAKSCEQGRVLLTAASQSGDVQGKQKLGELNTNGCP